MQTTYKLITGDGVVYAQPGTLEQVEILGGIDDATVTLYDAATASATNLCFPALEAAAGKSNWRPGASRHFVNGLYAVVTGTTPKVLITFRQVQ